MLDNETKRRIDTARDILVGKVPDPKSQVEQITIALIYKFMDDMDLEAEELDGEPSFFTGEYEKYGWRKIFDPQLGGFEMLSLYSEAILKMAQNPNLPQLFRDIFKNAYLPYRDPETLKSFLKEINSFTYDHSERLGDAFEYLLSVLGSQGDAGQFRTPRHIIDFMVALIDPKKNETILDPACGTAGFLISAYKHILKENSSNHLPGKDSYAFELHGVKLEDLTADTGKRYKGDRLTPDERKRISNNVSGYDISPDMVRLSLVNLYLHGFTDPHIYEYDTLTSEERWNEYYDIIMANPPFMSPKGGIRPHKRFTVESKRSEVLFVDYIAEHLTSTGRAAVVVPEGIIFQNGTAYKSLRKMLVEEHYLAGVISLPAGVFNPYSGVKTSILWMDKSLAKKTDKVLFAKIENDGFDLGAQRRPIKQNDLPEVFRQISQYKKALQNGEIVYPDDYPTFSLVPKQEIGDNGDYNLSAERYKKQLTINLDYPLVKLEEVCVIMSGGTPSRKENKYWNGDIPWVGSTVCKDSLVNKSEEFITEEGLNNSSAKIFKSGTTLIALVGATIGKTGYLTFDSATNQNIAGLYPLDSSILNPKFLFFISQTLYPRFLSLGEGKFRMATLSFVRNLQIPLPPLSGQKEIVAQIESYQKIIDGARQVVENYKPRIDIDPDWPMVELGELCSIGGEITKDVDEKLPYIGADSIESNTGHLLQIKSAEEQSVSGPVYSFSGKRLLYSKIRPYLNKLTLTEFTGYCSSDMYPLLINENKVLPEYIMTYMLSKEFNDNIQGYYERASIPKINRKQLFSVLVPLPSIDTQQTIVNHIGTVARLVNSNKQLIEIFEQKIKDRITKVWEGKKEAEVYA